MHKKPVQQEWASPRSPAAISSSSRRNSNGVPNSNTHSNGHDHPGGGSGVGGKNGLESLRKDMGGGVSWRDVIHDEKTISADFHTNDSHSKSGSKTSEESMAPKDKNALTRRQNQAHTDNVSPSEMEAGVKEKYGGAARMKKAIQADRFAKGLKKQAAERSDGYTTVDESLVVVVYQAEGLPEGVTRYGSYCTVTVSDSLLGTRKRKSVSKAGTIDPCWNQEFRFQQGVDGENPPALLTVDIHKTLRTGTRLLERAQNLKPVDDFIGRVEMSVTEAFPHLSAERGEGEPYVLPTRSDRAMLVSEEGMDEWKHVVDDQGKVIAGTLLRVAMRWERRRRPTIPWTRVLVSSALIMLSVAIVVISWWFTIPGCGAKCRSEWSDLRTLPEGVLDAAAVAVGGSLALMGGTSPKATSTDTVYTLRVDGKGGPADWTRATALQVGRSRFGAISFPGGTGSSILVLGGLNEPTAEVYSEFGGAKGAVVRMGLPGGEEGAWNQVKAVHLSSGVGQVCAVGEVGGKGVAAASVRVLITCLNCDNLIGGTSAFTQAIACSRLPPSLGASYSLDWTSNATVPTERLLYEVCSFQGGIAILGGWAGGAVPTVEWWKGGGTWVSVPDLSVPRYSLAAAEFAGRLVAIGGSDGYNSLTVVESWAEGEGVWRREVPIPLGGRQRHNVAVWGVGMEQRLYVLGGVRYDQGNVTFQRGVAAVKQLNEWNANSTKQA